MPERRVIRLLLLGQAFLLFLWLLTPHLLRWLGSPWGKALYAVLGALSVAQLLAIHHALRHRDL